MPSARLKTERRPTKKGDLPSWSRLRNERLLWTTKISKSYSILKRAINPDAIIFGLPKSEMDADSAAEEIVSQLGEIAGYTNLGLHYLKATSILLELFFEASERSQKTIANGIILNGIVYHDTPWVDEARKRTMKVKLKHKPLKLHQSLGEVLKRAVQTYGEVQVRKYTNSCRRIFREASIL